MDAKLLLVKSITLLYRESQLVLKTENSADLVRTAIETIKIPDIGIGINTEREALIALKATVNEMCSNPIDHDYETASLLQQLRMNCNYDEKLYEVFAQGIENGLSEAQVKRTIINLRKAINNHFREEKVDEILSKASYNFRFKRDNIRDINRFISEIVAQLEPLQMLTTTKDPAVIAEVDLGDNGAVSDIFKEVKNNSNSSGLLKTGWQDLNTMLQGGFRRGDYWIMPALQHKFKTGFSLSLFCQIAQYNIPYMIDPTKKPLLVRFSCEDKLAENLQFMYQKLKYDETGLPVDITGVTNEEMSAYIKTRLQVNGYHIKLIQIDPTQSSYKHLCNKIIELEAQGYEIHLCMVDQVGMLPTTGCNTSGATGTDKRDIIRRIRNFCLPKKITLITPHQLSTEAKQLIRNGLPEDKFVKDIAEKGYYEGSKQLDQEVDGEIYIHLFKHNKETFLAVQRGKHRISTILPDELKYFMFRFPKGMPIPDDLGKDKISFNKLPTAASNTDSSLFTF